MTCVCAEEEKAKGKTNMAGLDSKVQKVLFIIIEFAMSML